MEETQGIAKGKYFSSKKEKFTPNTKVLEMSLAKRIKFEHDTLSELHQANDVTCIVISYEWIEDWLNFVNSKGKVPSAIDHRSLEY